MEVALSILSVLGINGILLFFIKRFFDKKDSEAKEEKADRDALIPSVCWLMPDYPRKSRGC